MDERFKNMPEIISHSASSPLGILALMIIGLAILGFLLFRRASELSRILIFLMLLLGVAVLVGVIMRQTETVQTEASAAVAPWNTRVTPEKTPRARILPVNLEVTNKKLIVGDEGIDAIVSAKLDEHSDEKFSLLFDYRSTCGDGANVVGDDFRLFVEEVPRTPIEDPYITVARSSAEDGVFFFAIPKGAKNIVLQIGHPGDLTRSIPIDLNALKPRGPEAPDVRRDSDGRLTTSAVTHLFATAGFVNDRAARLHSSSAPCFELPGRVYYWAPRELTERTGPDVECPLEANTRDAKGDRDGSKARSARCESSQASAEAPDDCERK